MSGSSLYRRIYMDNWWEGMHRKYFLPAKKKTSADLIDYEEKMRKKGLVYSYRDAYYVPIITKKPHKK